MSKIFISLSPAMSRSLSMKSICRRLLYQANSNHTIVHFRVFRPYQRQVERSYYVNAKKAYDFLVIILFIATNEK